MLVGYRSISQSIRSLCKHLSCCITEDGKKLKLYSDADEPERRYHGVWLRHNCRCPQCLSATANQNVVGYENLINLKITSAQIKGIQLNWLLYNKQFCLQRNANIT